MFVFMVSIFTFFAVALGAMALLSPSSRKQVILGRLSSYTSGDDLTDFDRKLFRPLISKILVPILEEIRRQNARFMPDHMIADTDARLTRAGRPFGLGVDSFLVIKAVLFFVLPVGYAVYLFVGSNGHVSLLQWILLVGLFYGGFRLPDWWLDRKIGERQSAINRALPDTLDFIVICSEAGLAFEGAMSMVVERTKGPLSDEMRRALGEISLGKRRRDALSDMANRTQAQDLVSFISAVTLADQTGISIGNVLRVQADDLRVRRRQRAEREGREAPLKMLFPLIFFIFPATLIVIMGPAGLNIFDNMISP